MNQEQSFSYKDQLVDIAGKLKRATNEGKSGPLRYASEVVKLGEHWEDHREEAGHVDYTTWLRKVSGCNYAWWSARNEAVQKLGEWCRRQLDHDVAKYVARNVESKHIEQVCFMLRQEFKANNSIPISLSAAKHKINKLLKRRAHLKECESCKELRALLIQNGIKIPE